LTIQLAVALVAAAAASAVSNLPASVAFVAMLGSRGPPAYAALAALSAGALATPHGSVATLITFDRAGPRAAEPCACGYIKLLIPTTAIALAAATAAVWFLAAPA
jgi:arsenical pump membrane protein